MFILVNKRIFYIEWQHRCDSERMKAVLCFDNVEDLFDFFSFEEDPLVYFAFEDITDKPIEDVDRRVQDNGKYSV